MACEHIWIYDTTSITIICIKKRDIRHVQNLLRNGFISLSDDEEDDDEVANPEVIAGFAFDGTLRNMQKLARLETVNIEIINKFQQGYGWNTYYSCAPP